MAGNIPFLRLSKSISGSCPLPHPVHPPILCAIRNTPGYHIYPEKLLRGFFKLKGKTPTSFPGIGFKIGMVLCCAPESCKLLIQTENMPESQYPVMLWCGEDAVNTSLSLRHSAWSFQSIWTKFLPLRNLIYADEQLHLSGNYLLQLAQIANDQVTLCCT